MDVKKRRIDGWKSIAAFFKRNRTTVMRWAQTRDLPVHKVPGAGSTSVYAYAEELETWLNKNNGENKEIANEAQPEKSNTKTQSTRFWILTFFSISCLIAAISAFTISNAQKPQLPKNAEASALYIQAREDWASRTADGLHASIAEFQEVIKREPNFAPAYASLSDAYLLVREFDATPDAIAYPKAEEAANKALEIDNNSPEANRALGFISYWWHRDIAKAKIHFEKSFKILDNSNQTHFWYGNALVDNGQYEKGLQELEKARLGEPASLSIQADYAWALWSSGQYESGEKRLLQLATRDNFSSPYTYLAYIALSKKDWRGYLEFTEKRATLRKDPKMLEIVNKQKLAFKNNGENGLINELTKVTISDPGAPVSDSSWPAALAALSGNRELFLRILQQADQRNEIWGFSGFTQSVFKDWQKDAQIAQLLNKRRGQKL